MNAEAISGPLVRVTLPRYPLQRPPGK
jgi:hypothetical protein